MRVVGGEFRGRALATPSGAAIRPTSDRLRESLFNRLAHGLGDPVPGARVLDLFAGTGALGIEALSRGAAFALFVEIGAEGRGLIRSNVEAFGLTGRTRIFRRDATDLGPVAPLAPFDLVFADPPYNKGLGERAFASALAGGWLAPGAMLVLEEDAKAEIAPIEGLEEIDRRETGVAQVRLFRNGF